MSADGRGRASVIVLASLVIAALLGAILYEGRKVVLPPLAHWLDVGSMPEQVDFVVTLPGGEEHRPFVAAALFNAGLARKVLVPATVLGPDAEDGIAVPAHEVIRRVLRYRKVPDDSIVLLQGASGSTAGDIELVARYLEDFRDAKLAFVTNGYHTRRARLAVRAGLGVAAGRAIMVSAPNPDFDTDRWWETERGFRTITTEYVKLVAYWLVYGDGVWWIAGAAAGGGLWWTAKRLKWPRMAAGKA